MNSSLAKGFSCSGWGTELCNTEDRRGFHHVETVPNYFISLHLLDISGVIPWPDVWYLDISLGETGTGCFA